MLFSVLTLGFEKKKKAPGMLTHPFVFFYFSMKYVLDSLEAP